MNLQCLFQVYRVYTDISVAIGYKHLPADLPNKVSEDNRLLIKNTLQENY